MGVDRTFPFLQIGGRLTDFMSEPIIRFMDIPTPISHRPSTHAAAYQKDFFEARP